MARTAAAGSVASLRVGRSTAGTGVFEAAGPVGGKDPGACRQRRAGNSGNRRCCGIWHCDGGGRRQASDSARTAIVPIVYIILTAHPANPAGAGPTRGLAL